MMIRWTVSSDTSQNLLKNEEWFCSTSKGSDGCTVILSSLSLTLRILSAKKKKLREIIRQLFRNIMRGKSSVGASRTQIVNLSKQLSLVAVL